MWKWLLRLTLHWQFCQLSQVSFMLAHQTVLMVEPSDCIKGNRKSINSPPAPFSPGLHCRWGRVTAAINWGLLFSLFSITVLFWTLLLWLPLCRNKAGQNTYLFFALNTDSLHATQAHMATSTTTMCQATTMKHKHHRSTKQQTYSSWQIQLMTQHA